MHHLETNPGRLRPILRKTECLDRRSLLLSVGVIRGRSLRIGALLLGSYSSQGELLYAGRVGHWHAASRARAGLASALQLRGDLSRISSRFESSPTTGRGRTMKRTRFTEEQIIGVLREQAGEDCRCLPQARRQRGDVYKRMARPVCKP